MKRWIVIWMVAMVSLHAEKLYKVTPSEMVMMDTIEDDAPTTIEVGASQTQAPSERNATQVDVEVISADEYLADTGEEMQTADLSDLSVSKPKIALLVPRKVIGAYANSVANAILSYLLYQKSHFIFELFDSGTQSREDLTLALGKIRQKGYRIIVAPLTPSGANTLAALQPDALVYVPTVNSMDMESENPNFLYGGIDYEAQIDALLSYAQPRIAVFGDGSALAKKLMGFIQEKRLEDIVYHKEIKNAKANQIYLLKGNRKLKNASVFLNMPVVKSALMAAQMSRYKVPYANILSTQVSYSPLLFTLTQYPDRRKFYIANAISSVPFGLEDTDALLGSDIRFNWINYAASVGIDYILTDYLHSGRAKQFGEPMIDRQVYYNTTVMRAGEGSFIPVGDFDAKAPEREMPPQQ